MVPLLSLPLQFPEYEAYLALMQRCWAQDPADRPAFAEIIGELRGLLSRTLAASGGIAAAGSLLPPSSSLGLPSPPVQDNAAA